MENIKKPKIKIAKIPGKKVIKKPNKPNVLLGLSRKKPGINQDITVNLESLKSPSVFASKRNHKRNLTKLLRKETAAEAIKDFSKELDVFGFTKGQFSLIELIEAVLEKTGPAKIDISTWTAANADLRSIYGFLETKNIISARFLLDFSFQRRQPAVAKQIRNIFGLDSLRITRNHAKFFLISNENWKVVCKTSMNLNQNPRFEDFDLSTDPDLFSFLQELFNEFFKKTISNQDFLSNKQLCQEFKNH